jgi:hypothetical protein
MGKGYRQSGRESESDAQVPCEYIAVDYELGDEELGQVEAKAKVKGADKEEATAKATLKFHENTLQFNENGQVEAKEKE